MATPGLRHNRDWHKLWFAQAVSLVGDFVFNTTLVLWVGTVIAADRPWAPAAVGGVLIAGAAPVLLVGPVAGVYVDRWDRRKIMLVTDLIRAGLIAVLLLIPLAGTDWPVALQLVLVYAVAALTSAASQFFNPARFTIVAATVPPEDRPSAFGLLTATSSVAAVVGPPLAAPLLFASGVEWALVVNVVSFLLSYLAIRLMRVTEPERSPARPDFWAEFREGIRFFAGNRTLVVIVSSICLYMFGVGAINVLDVFFVTENLRVDAGWLGTLSGALGVGSILGALLAGRLSKRFGDVAVFSFGIVLTGLAIVVYSRMPTLPAAIVVLGLAGIPLAAVNVVVGPLVLRVTPEHLLGRMNAVTQPLVYLSSILSMAVAGFLASTVLRDFHASVGGVTFGRIDTIFAVCGLLMTAAGLAAARPLARSANRDPDRSQSDRSQSDRPASDGSGADGAGADGAGVNGAGVDGAGAGG
jgi:MFS family permease